MIKADRITMNTLRRILRKPKRWLQLRLRFWREYLTHGEWELRELPHYVRSDALALDIGGNMGVYAYHLHRLASKVVVFEPNPDHVQIIDEIKMKNCRVDQVALSDHAGAATLRIPRLQSGHEDDGMASLENAVVPEQMLSRSIDVPIRRLDDYSFQNVGFIKIDVEGHEEKVLSGALDTIKSNHPTLLIEVEERHNPGGLRRIRDTLADLGYAGYFFVNTVKVSIDQFDLNSMQKITDIENSKDTRRRSIKYVNNFLFVHAAGV